MSDEDDSILEVQHEVVRGSNLDLLLRGYLGLGNRLVDALLAIASAIAGKLEAADLDKIVNAVKEVDDEAKENK